MANLPEHGHCESCGDPVPFGENFCNDECSKEYMKDVREAKRLDNRLYMVMGAVLVVAAVVSYAVKFYIL
ncbi:MAG: DUF2116 family Zn-ribbon domain-containing protein [Methanomassiliicoccaceae archaeon]|jgi:predicted nucleic acid-binding Zn ribbon protein|nr:DUF2116 family Zn-ribbon domain-containing protein [Methanomassiliicoccaceae archaeon]